jgi:ribosomal protein L44E
MNFSKADRMCYGKHRYASQIKAYGGIGKLQSRYNPNTSQVALRAYECPVCRGWHLTKKPFDDPSTQKLKWMSGQNLRDCT